MIDLAKFSVEQLKSLRTEIAGELAKRAGENIDLRYEEAPQGGAMFYDRPAIGGDRNRDLWFPTLEAANAHLVGLSSGLPVSVREDGSMYCDYTTQGHSQSDMETRLVVTPRIHKYFRVGPVADADHKHYAHGGPHGTEPTSSP